MTTAELTHPKARTKRLWTYAEMMAELPEINLTVELWNGEIIISPAPHPNHQLIVRSFYKILDEYIERQKLGQVFVSPVDVVLTPRRVVQPDVLFISQARLGIVKDCIDGVPDLAMEVISEHSWQRDRIEKKALYEQAGLPEYWIVDLESETIEVFASYHLYCRATRSQKAKSKLLPGFGISFKELLR